MSNLLNLSLRHASFTLRSQAYRLLQKTQLGQTVKECLQKPQVNGRNFCSRPYDLDTRVAKDVVLFKYENPRFYNMLNLFAICQFLFWNYLSNFAFTTLKDAPVEPNPDVELKWYQRINLGENKYRNGITVLCFAIGYGILAAAWMFTTRSVRFLILRKGGQEVSLVTYGPFNKNRIMNVPLKDISAQASRSMTRVQLPLKIRDRSFYYVMDMRGEFRNPQLFDYTAGLRRTL